MTPAIGEEMQIFRGEGEPLRGELGQGTYRGSRKKRGDLLRRFSQEILHGDMIESCEAVQHKDVWDAPPVLIMRTALGRDAQASGHLLLRQTVLMAQGR